nr:UL36 [Gallid alphaherpesvirus 2]
MHNTHTAVYNTTFNWTGTAAASSRHDMELNQYSPGIVTFDNLIDKEGYRHESETIPRESYSEHRKDLDWMSTPTVIANASSSLITNNDYGGIGGIDLKKYRFKNGTGLLRQGSPTTRLHCRKNNSSRSITDILVGTASPTNEPSPLLQRLKAHTISGDKKANMDAGTIRGRLYDYSSFWPPCIQGACSTSPKTIDLKYLSSEQATVAYPKHDDTHHQTPTGLAPNDKHSDMHISSIITETDTKENSIPGYNNIPMRHSSESESLTSLDSDSDDSHLHVSGSTDTTTDGSSTSRVIPADALLTRRDFRNASRGALYALTKACKKVARQIVYVREQLRTKVATLAIELFKIKMILTG